MKTKKEQNQIEISPAALKSWRLESKYSIPQAARLIGANRATWERWEKGLTEPSEEHVARLTALMKEERDFSNISSETLELIEAMTWNFDYIHSQLGGLAFGADEFQSLPFRSLAKGGPNRYSSNLKLLDILFASLYKSEKLPQNRTRIFGQIKYLMGFAGYFVGRLKYSVDDFHTEEIGKTIASIISDLLGLRALLKKESPKHADGLWITAFDKLPLGYCLALDEQFWPEDGKREEQLLACAINNQEAFEYIVPKMSSEDFNNEENASTFCVICDSRGAKVARKKLGRDTIKHLDEIWSKLRSDHPEERLGAMLQEVLPIKLWSLMRHAQRDLLKLAADSRTFGAELTPEVLGRLKELVSEIHSLAEADEEEDESNEMMFEKS